MDKSIVPQDNDSDIYEFSAEMERRLAQMSDQQVEVLERILQLLKTCSKMEGDALIAAMKAQFTEETWIIDGEETQAYVVGLPTESYSLN